MSEESRPRKISRTPLSDAEYDAILLTLTDTKRGRWFLQEHIRRTPASDTEAGLAALQRLQAAAGQGDPAALGRVRGELANMRDAIARTKADIALLRLPEANRSGISEAAAQDAVVHAAEAATSRILSVAEHVQEIAWILRERDLAPDVCNQLDTQANEIYSACAFHDVTAQHMRKMIRALRYLEQRIEAAIEICGGNAAPAHAANAGDRQDASMEDIGRVMRALDPVAESSEHPSQAAETAAAALEEPADFLLAPADVPAGQSARPPAPKAPPPSEPSDPLAPLRALSEEEKIALFS